MDIAPHARKHGVSDEGMLHAIQHVVTSTDAEALGATLYIGPDHAGNFLEVVVLDDDPEEQPIVIHAMKMRAKYQRLLPRSG